MTLRRLQDRDEHNHLVSVTRPTRSSPFPDGTIRDTENDENGAILDPDALVSMNFFGFTPWLLQEAEKYFIKFMKSLSPDEAEYVLPVLVDRLMHEEEGRHAQDLPMRSGLA